MDANRRQGRGKSFSKAGRREPDAGTFFAVPDARLSQPTVDSPSLQLAARWKTCESVSQGEPNAIRLCESALYVRRSIQLRASAGRRFGGGSGWRVSTCFIWPVEFYAQTVRPLVVRD